MGVNNDKRIQSKDSIGTYAYYETNKEITRKNKEIICLNMIKKYKYWLNMVMLQKQTKNTIIQIGHEMLIMSTEYQ